MDSDSKKANGGPVNFLNLPLEVVQHILLDTFLVDQPDSGCDRTATERVDQPGNAWDGLSRYRSETEPDYVLPYEHSRTYTTLSPLEDPE
jgi:hypothetical protein